MGMLFPDLWDAMPVSFRMAFEKVDNLAFLSNTSLAALNTQKSSLTGDSFFHLSCMAWHGMASSQARHQHGIYSDCCSMHLCDAYFAWSPFQQQQLQAQIHLHIHTLCPSSKHPLCPSLVRAIAGFIFLSICSSCQKMRKLTFCSNIGLLYIKLILFSC